MKYVQCNLCGADNWTVLHAATLKGTLSPQVDAFRCTNPGYGEHAQIVRCHECSHVYANPTWETHELMAAYEAVEDDTYVTERDGRVLTFEKHLDRIEALIGKAQGRTLLDVGAYIGVFVEIAQRRGWLSTGVEPSEWGVQQAQANGLNVIEGTLQAPALTNQQFDLITMWDVIEHVSDPSAELRQARTLLKPGGMIVVHTMNIDSPIAKLMGKRWPWFMAMHVHYFGKRSLIQMMEQCGYQVLRAPTEGRYLRLGYIATRLGGLNAALGKIAAAIINKAGLAEKPIPISFGDLFTVYAINPNLP